jgi:hypothetical protein
MTIREQIMLTLRELGESTIPEIIAVRAMPKSKTQRQNMSKIMHDLERRGAIERVRIQARQGLPPVIVYRVASNPAPSINPVDERFEKATMRQREHWAMSKRRFDKLKGRELEVVLESGAVMLAWWKWFCETERAEGRKRTAPDEARNPSGPIERYIAERYGRNDRLDARLTALAFWWVTSQIEWASQWRGG